MLGASSFKTWLLRFTKSEAAVDMKVSFSVSFNDLFSSESTSMLRSRVSIVFLSLIWAPMIYPLPLASKSSRSRKGSSSPRKRSRSSSPSSSPERGQKRSRSRSSSGERKKRRSRSRSSERFGFMWNKQWCMFVTDLLGYLMLSPREGWFVFRIKGACIRVGCFIVTHEARLYLPALGQCAYLPFNPLFFPSPPLISPFRRGGFSSGSSHSGSQSSSSKKK